MNDGDCLQACYKAGGLKRRDTISAQSYGAVPERRQTERRADPLNCVAQEGCYKFTDGSLLCLNLGTGKCCILEKSEEDEKTRRPEG